MEYLKVIEEFLPNVFKEIKEDIISQPEILNFVDGKEKLINLIDEQSSILMDYFVRFPDASEVNLSKVEKFYENLDIPYIIVMKNIDMLKNKLLERLVLEKELDNKEFIFEITKYIDSLRNKIAYIYLKKDIKKLRDINAKTFRKYLLYQANLNFVEKIINAIENDDLSSFPVQKAEECDFYKYLQYPESIMACMDANLCSYIEDQHKTIHKVSNSLYAFLLKNKLTDAYTVFKELSENVLKLSKTLAELYFAAFSDAEINFFRLLEYLTEVNESRFVFIIDLQNLKNLNKIYSEKKINLLLKKLEEKLKEYVNPKKEHLLLIRGITANFYMLAYNYPAEKINQLVYDVKNLIENEKIDKEEKILKVSIGVLELDKRFEISKDEFVKILLYIKELAKEEENSIKLAIGEEEKEKILNWIAEKYQNIKFIKEKLSNRKIDVVFQPIFETKDNSIGAVETLARIVDDNGSLIPAGVFIDIIYQYNMIYDLDILVLEKLIEKKKMLKIITDKIFINLSSETLLRREFYNKWQKFTQEMSDFNIVVEITEQRLVEDIEIIKKLKCDNTFVSFAIDDFGSGYSSLKTVVDMVKNRILHILKIDGSLIKEVINDEYSEKIVKTVANMTDNLSIDAVAEFVENDETLQKLKELNIRYVQGFYLSKPKPIEDLLTKVLNS